MTTTTFAEAEIIVDLMYGVKINDLTVTVSDIGASNRVIHIIDAVLFPPFIDLLHS